MKKDIQFHTIISLHESLTHHPVYLQLADLPSLRTFMESHVYAVWDFMSLLKSLQKRLTCIETPWVESPYPPKMVRLINEIVLAEESDIDDEGNVQSHFSLYLKAMDEVGADKRPILESIRNWNGDLLMPEVKNFTQFTLNLASTGTPEEVAASFFYGRENIIPSMFSSIKKMLNENSQEYPTLIQYLKRHIELDENKHGPLAKECLAHLCGNDSDKWDRAYQAAIRSLELRAQLWDGVLKRNRNWESYS